MLKTCWRIRNYFLKVCDFFFSDFTTNYISDKILNERLTFKLANINEYSTLFLLPEKNTPLDRCCCCDNEINVSEKEKEEKKKIEISFKEYNGTTIDIKVNKFQTIKSIKEILQKLRNIIFDDKILLFGGFFFFFYFFYFICMMDRSCFKRWRNIKKLWDYWWKYNIYSSSNKRKRYFNSN
jgi:hypothetical protein